MDEIRGVRKKNVIKIIQSLVKQGGCTKNELVFYTGLSLSTIDSLLEDISSGQALPNHVKDACKYCAYRSICRNSANEVEPKLRVEKEEE